MTADPARDLIFVPTSSAAPDYYGALRLGDNRYANSIVALRASTGRVVWHFQTVHHDLWDYDNASPPALVTVTRDGKSIPAVAQATKTGMLFVLHRETGVPIFPVEERKVPASTIPGEEASPTQPFTTVTPPLSPHSFTVDQAFGINAEGQAACKQMMAGLRNEGIFTPPSLEGTLAMPSNIGGAHWGGVAADNQSGIVVVPVNRVAAMVQLIPAKGFDLSAARQESSRLGQGYEYTMMEGTPYIMRRRHPARPGSGAVHAAAVRRARRGQSANGRQVVGRATRHAAYAAGRPCAADESRHAEPRRTDRDRRTSRLHRGDARSHVPRIRPRQRQRAVEDAASRRRPRDADDIRSRRPSVRGDCGGWRK